MPSLFWESANRDGGKGMNSTCRHCGEHIALIGIYWIHLKTDRRRCEASILAEPVEDLRFVYADASFPYQEGLRDGRKAALFQEKRSYNWNKQPLPLSAHSISLLNHMLTERLPDMKRVETTMITYDDASRYLRCRAYT